MNKKFIYILFILLIYQSFQADILLGTVTSVTVTPANRTTLSNGSDYYLAGIPYTFRVQATSNNVIKTDWNQITLIIGGTQQVDINIDTDTVSSTTELYVVNSNIQDNTVNYGTGDLDYSVTLKFEWNGTSLSVGANSVYVRVTDDNPPFPTLPDSDNVTNTSSFGVCTTIQVLNFTQDGEAGDGMVNPDHDDFNVSGSIVYNVNNPSSSDKVSSSEISSISLRLGALTVNTPSGPDFLNIITAGSLSGGLSQNWYVIVTMNTTPVVTVSSISTSTLSINCMSLVIDSIQFINGGGITDTVTPLYFKSVNLPGAQIRVTARMYDGTSYYPNMSGNTTIHITETINDYYVLISHGNNTGTVNIETAPHVYPVIPAGTTELRTYDVVGSTGGNYDTIVPAGIPTGNIQQTCYWENFDPPGSAAVGTFTDFPATYFKRTAYSLTFYWENETGVKLDSTLDADFSTYRIYYKEAASADWKVIDKDVTTPTDYSSLGTISTSSVTIPELKPLTEYNYYITALDIFGNEVALNNALYDHLLNYNTLATLPSSIEISISDGITSFTDESFDDLTPTTRALRNSSIKVTINIVTGESQPDSVNIILSEDITVDLVSAGVLAGNYSRIEAKKISANNWVSYIPTTNEFMGEDKELKFIIESVRGDSKSYSDHNSELEDPSGIPVGIDPNDMEYTFYINKVVIFKPWPVRILNNVITSKNPVAYPSYFLTDNAYVTIKVYDIKGRAVATILEKAYRKGGQNIKDKGWRGINKSRRKLGVGLYYIRITAKRVTDNKLILNKVKKVVIAY